MQIFISYSRVNSEKANTIANALKSEGYDVWIDSRSIDPGFDFTGAIENGIENADIFLVLLSKDTERSDSFVRREIQYALLRGKSIFPVIIERGAKVPISIVNYIWIDISRFPTGADIIYLVESINRAALNIKFDADPNLLTKPSEAKEILQGRKPIDRVFIAYSRKQRSLAKELYELLVKNHKAVFYDAKIRAGARWRLTIQKALDDATHVTVIWTPEAAESDEVEREVSYALAEHKVIVPILSKEIPKLPYHLHGLHYIVLDEDLLKIEMDLLKALEQHKSDEDIWQ